MLLLNRRLHLHVPSSVSVSLAVPLTALGTVTAFVLLRARFGRTVRRLINLLDPIQPSEDEVVAAALAQRIPIDDVEAYIREADDAPVVNGAERTIRWANNGAVGERTALCVVFLHGWGACRQECRPVPERIAEALGANLYCGRLPGHGRRHRRGRMGGGGPDGDTLVEEATPRALFRSAVEALRVGLSLGDRVVFLGMSTGGVLATWIASLPSVQHHIAALALISPAYALGHPLYPLLKHTFSTLRLLPESLASSARTWLIGAAVGEIKSSPPLSEEHNRFNSLVYPSAALLNLLDVLWTCDTVDYSAVAIPCIVFGNPQDHVTNFRVKATNAFLRFGEIPKALHCVTTAEHPHVVASEMLSPSTVDEVSDAAILFLQTHATVRKGDDGARLVQQQSGILVASGRKPSVGMGSFASFASLQDLKRPLDA